MVKGEPSSARPDSGSPRARRTDRRAQALADYKRDQARQRRQSRLLLAASVVVAVIVVAAAVVAIGLNRKSGPSEATTTASKAVTAGLASVPAATYDAVGAGSVTAGPKPIKAPALTSSGKPRVLYIGAEYCPYCAAERWAVAAALSRFGTFNNLSQTASSPIDVFPNTATLSFHGATYQSRYLSFTGVETTTNKPQGSGYAPLDKPTPADEKIFATYDFPPYVSTNGGSIPFVDLGGRYVQSGSSYDPGLLKGLTHLQILRAMHSSSSQVGQAIDGAANGFTAALCSMTNGQPGQECSSAGVKAAAATLGL